MKLLFSSSDPAQVTRMSTKLVAAGIPCEVRSTPPDLDFHLAACYPELWVQKPEDFRMAMIVFATGWRWAHQG
jgi:hypothetical protein